VASSILLCAFVQSSFRSPNIQLDSGQPKPALAELSGTARTEKKPAFADQEMDGGGQNACLWHLADINDGAEQCLLCRAKRTPPFCALVSANDP